VAKKITLLIFPEEGCDRVKRLCFPRSLIPILLVVLAGSLGLTGYWLSQYHGTVDRLPSLRAHQAQSRRQQAQIQAFAGRLEELKAQVAKLKDFNERLRVMANLDKPGRQDEIFGVGGREGTASGPGIRLSASSSERRLQMLQRDLDRLSAESEAERQLQRHLAAFLNDRRSILAATPSIWPVRGWVTSGYGRRISPFAKNRRFHAGVDISTRRGTPIVAPAAGVITFAGREGGFGRMVAINHGRGIVTRYAHLDKIKVKVGQKVARGEVIATVGNTGRSTGPHLHYEVLLSGVPTNPMYYILD
jgi:murein DD-endopeptidase MepM/ murein hydrolase activator NlpD